MILALDTTTKNFSIAIKDEKTGVIKEIFIPNSEFTHSEIIIKNFDTLLKKTKSSIKEIKKIICTSGPGSWTGIRVGLSFARTLAQILKIPIISVSTLDLLAYKKLLKIKNKCLICATIPANQDEFHIAIYECIDRKIKRISEYTSLNKNEIPDFLNKHIKKKFKIFFASEMNFSAKDLFHFSNKRAKHFSKITPLYIKLPKIHKDGTKNK